MGIFTDHSLHAIFIQISKNTIVLPHSKCYSTYYNRWSNGLDGSSFKAVNGAGF